MKTTFSRTFSTAAIILLLALILVGTSFQALVEDYLTESAVADLQQNCDAISNLASAYCSEGPLLNRDFMVNLDVASEVSGSDLIICDAAGRIVLCSDVLTGCDHQNLSVDRAYLSKVIKNNGDIATGLIKGLYEESRYVVSTPISDPVTGQNLGIVMVSRPTVLTTGVMTKIGSIFVMVSFLVIVICIIAVGIIVQRQNEPLKEVAKAARSFGHGDLQARVRLGGDYPEEIEELARSFNNMATELQKSEYQRKEFVANVSHEFKTPMTTIGGFINGILDGTIPPEKQNYYLEIVSSEVKRLSKMVNAMLNISRIETGNLTLNIDRFNVSNNLLNTFLTFEQLITEKNITVEGLEELDSLIVPADQSMLDQVIYNLVDNAVKFTNNNGTIKIETKQDSQSCCFSIRNTGAGIPPEHIKNIFDRFYKVDESRSSDTKSTGLGLHLVKSIIELHGGKVTVKSEENKFTEFTVKLQK